MKPSPCFPIGFRAMIAVSWLLLPSLEINAASASVPAGAATPFTTLEAEAGELKGGAQINAFKHGSPVPGVATLELEASGSAYVRMEAEGSAVSWTNPVDGANAIVVRSSIGDAPSGKGGGIRATLHLYVNGTFRQALQLSSEQSWIYRTRSQGWRDDPQSGGMPFHFYNEDRAKITGAPLPKGCVLTLRKDAANTAARHDIDCVDLERVAPPLLQPARTLSVVDFGADPTGVKDSQEAIQKCADAARTQGLGVWIPAGRYIISSVKASGLEFKGVAVNGAGMWHTMLYRQVPNPLPALVSRWRSSIKIGARTTLRDLSVDCNAVTRNIGKAGGGDYGIQSSGDGWLIERVWVQHCDAQWLSGSNGTIRQCRVADSWGDGINLNNGNRPNPDSTGMNLTAEQNFVRGTGDDGLAVYSDGGDAGDNTQMSGIRFIHNTAVAPYWANCLRVAGGRNILVRNNLLTDSSGNCGLYVGVFGSSGQPLESVVVEGNVILRGGGWNGTDRHGVGIGSGKAASGIVMRDNIVGDSRRAGIAVDMSLQNLLLERNQISRPAMAGILIRKGARGSIRLAGNGIRDLPAGQQEVKNEAGAGQSTGTGGGASGLTLKVQPLQNTVDSDVKAP